MLLILAVVAISAIKNDGILGNAENAIYQHARSEADETIKLVMDEWAIVKYNQSGKTLETFLNEQKTEGTLSSVTSLGDNFVVEVVKGGTTFAATINKDGKIEGEVGEVLAKPTYTNLEIKKSDGTVVTQAGSIASGETLTINFSGALEGGTVTKIEPELPYSVTKNGIYEFTIAGTIDGKTSVGKVAVPINQFVLQTGAYVEYDVSYTDVYNETKYTSTTGWKYFRKDEAGNNLIISTGCPVQLYYHSDATNIDKDGVEGGWWGTTEQAIEEFNEDYGIQNRVAYGLKKNFTRIPFNQGTIDTSDDTTKNTGSYIQIGNKTSGQLFQNGANEFIPEGITGAKVRPIRQDDVVIDFRLDYDQELLSTGYEYWVGHRGHLVNGTYLGYVSAEGYYSLNAQDTVKPVRLVIELPSTVTLDEILSLATAE